MNAASAGRCFCVSLSPDSRDRSVMRFAATWKHGTVARLPCTSCIIRKRLCNSLTCDVWR